MIYDVFINVQGSCRIQRTLLKINCPMFNYNYDYLHVTNNPIIVKILNTSKVYIRGKCYYFLV
jgi:hypothetical protein